jgi:acyl-CoA synthetase (AMP-forming)/AMP-acid ligase II
MATMSWNFGDLLDGVEAALPGDALALAHGDRTLTWSDLKRRSNNLAAALLARGAQPGDRVAFYQRNGTEYMEALAACFKARLVHVNVNYRYLDDELWYILDNSDARFVVFGAEFSDRLERIRTRLPLVARYVQVGGAPLAWAEGFEGLAEGGSGEPLGLERSPDDLLFVYTGGTTGMPKGVMWRAGDLWGALGSGRNAVANGGEPPATPEAHIANVGRFGPAPGQIPACPLMHGTGLFTAIGTLSAGGPIVTLESQGFDPIELFDTLVRRAAASVVIVGDAFARPMLKALEEHPGRWDLSALKLIVSSGVMWSREVKQGLLSHHKGMLLVDSFGSSEAVGFGTSVSSAAGETRTARFAIGESCKVFTEDHREVLPGSGERGFIARSGPIPLGYHKDPKKSAETFPAIGGVRYSMPGDWCSVEADGTLTLLGRGSVCINTAGEKVHPEEVEEALKTHPDVEDALVLGLPDEKWGQAVTAVVQVRSGSQFDEAAVRAHVRARLAGYKTPKHVVPVARMFRAPNGKADYKSAAAHAASVLERS